MGSPRAVSDEIRGNFQICEELTNWQLSTLSEEQYQRLASFPEGECVIKC